ncbi:restriction enzyme [Marinomonas ushuaiensis DSM 15871]|uniref:site-specific DNA-methyltransferase (adenine-specific) n=1 Tax=Marinomonas ushuaiensis DSM 15871 TaxID=1122207 RepID=X7E3E4_9GAMM|nr:BREX-1 system adenine-specific DNA-methyltransferase PglX [Marinomonas ushuaiensis]ETX09698.1 restriction enzyme [Marinomonas ushuaiensis DSM 15871]
MNTANLKAYAPKARRDFIAAITKQSQKYGVTKDTIHPVQINGNVCVVNGKPFPANMAPRIQRLAERVERLGFEQTIEQVAYSWFNRLIAIRYMELHDYLGHGRRVLSHPEHPTGFQILEECTDLSYGNDGDAGQLPHLSHEKVVELKLDGTKDEELYRELLLAQCHALHNAMPFLFERVDDETELLLPENLTKTDSLIHDLITDLAESDWESIEVVGWLYQFYISEKKDQVIGKVVKTEDIPAATQLFTPNWIVKYMVQNSLGAQWLATYPDSPLKAQMEYYIEPAEQTDAVNAQLKEITPTELNPEALTLIDPASGSGHILVEAYDLFKAIYLERGYRQRDIAQLILEKNLFGLDIDQRAAQLTGFALMMKGREDDRRLFERGVKLNVMAMVDSTSLDVDTLVHGIELSQYGLNEKDLIALKDLFEHATTFGSLIQMPQTLAEKLPALKLLSETNSQDMFVKEILEHLSPLVQQTKILAEQYDAVVANPPYIGAGYLNDLIKVFSGHSYPETKADIFSMFMHRCMLFGRSYSLVSLMTPFTWLSIKSFEGIRNLICESKDVVSLVQPEYHAFFESAYVPICTFVLRNSSTNIPGIFVDLSPFYGANIQSEKFLEVIKDRNHPQRYEKETSVFRYLPGKAILFGLSRDAISLLSNSKRIGELANISEGIKTGDNQRFLRFWPEISAEKNSFFSIKAKKWRPHHKGGEYRRWYGNLEHVINWENDGEEIKESSSSGLQGRTNYFSEGVTWSKLSSSYFGVRLLPNGVLFDSGSPAVFPENQELTLPILGFLSSNVVSFLVKKLNPTLNFQVGNISTLPFPLDSSHHQIAWITEIVRNCVKLSKEYWDSFETSWEFRGSPLLSGEKRYALIKDTLIDRQRDGEKTVELMRTLEEKNNSAFIELLGMQGELDHKVTNSQITIGRVDSEKDCKHLVSYAIGCMMGRYSLDAPGLIYANSGNEGFDASQYTTFPADDDGIIPLTDAEWFADDAANRVEEFVSVAWPASSETGNHLEENLDFLAANLSPKKSENSRDTIRRYLCDKFYKDHMQTYKKRPIYWLFSSGKQKAFQCLVYLHRYNESTLARMRTEYVIPLTAKLSAHINKLDDDKLASGSAAEIKKLEKEIKRLQKQQTELTEFDEKLKHFADMRISLDLDDGVKVNYGKFGDLLADVKDIHGKKV